jgi:hypothetical protein
LVTLFANLHSQEIANQYSIKLNPNLSNQWWSTYNSYGIAPSKIELAYRLEKQNKKIKYNFLIYGSKNRIYIGESFFSYKLPNNNFIKLGRYYRDFSSYLNDNLSSGSMLISNNAEPLPKVGFLGSYNIKKNKNFNLNFGIAHGFFKKNQLYKSAPMLHEKFIYLNYSKENKEWGIGLVHEAMWAGSTEKYGDFPSSFNDFLKVLIASDEPLRAGQDHANAIGNHLGIWDFYYKKNSSDRTLKFYYQHFFEDTSGLRFANRFDGLWGLELKNYLPNNIILFEYLNTMNQDRDPPYVNDTYYNHAQYSLGWSYKNYTIGNPFLNYLDPNPSKVFHIGIGSNKSENHTYKLLISRRINISDPIKFKVVYSKVVNKFLIDFFIIGQEGQRNNLGIQTAYFFNDRK